MANNPYVNKVLFNDTVLLDLTADTVTASDVALGKTFHLPSGAVAIGTAQGDEEMYLIEGVVDSSFSTITWTDRTGQQVNADVRTAIAQGKAVYAHLAQYSGSEIDWDFYFPCIALFSSSCCYFSEFDPNNRQMIITVYNNNTMIYYMQPTSTIDASSSSYEYPTAPAVYNALSAKTDTADIDHEEWEFTLEDDTTVTKEVMLWAGE